MQPKARGFGNGELPRYHVADLRHGDGSGATTARRGTPPPLDSGFHYASAAYRSMLAHHDVTASMSRKANCYDNAVMEAFWSTLKNELVH